VFTDIEIPCLFIVSLLKYVIQYLSSVSVFSSDSVGLVIIIFLHVDVHRVKLMLKCFIMF